MHSSSVFSSQHSSMAKPQALSELSLSAACLKIVDYGIGAIIFIAPMFFGGRHDLGRGIFISLVAVVSVAWFIRQSTIKNATITRTWSYLVAVLAILLVIAQLIPLPEEWLQNLAQRNFSLLTLWNKNTSTSLGAWQSISVAPESTRIALAMLIAYVLLFFVTVGRLQSLEDIKQLLRCIALSAVLMAVFGLLQLFTSNKLYFWFYEYPYAATDQVAKGSFSCRNHFAHFLVLGFGPLLAWAIHGLKGGQEFTRSKINSGLTVFLVVSMLIVVLAILLSISRGGAIALLVSGAVSVAIFLLSKNLIRNSSVWIRPLCHFAYGFAFALWGRKYSPKT